MAFKCTKPTEYIKENPISLSDEREEAKSEDALEYDMCFFKKGFSCVYLYISEFK